MGELMRFGLLFAATIASVIGIGGYTSELSRAVELAVELRDGKVYFDQPPRLVEAVTNFNDVNFWDPTYYFTVSLPENAVEPLSRITINQHEGVDNMMSRLEDVYVFEGARRSNQGRRRTIQNVIVDKKNRTLSLVLNPPIQPGKTITIAMEPVQNPSVSGVYLFGVTAFPQGEKPHGQFLGYGRLQFYNSNIR
jgi:Protein of unknown function (DUF2808)